MHKMIKAAAIVAGLVGSSMAFALEGDALQMEIDKMIAEGDTGAATLRATVEDGGTVMLSGYAEGQNQINTLIEEIRNLDGVTDVISDATAQ